MQRNINKIKISSILKIILLCFLVVNMGLMVLSYYFYNLIMAYSQTNVYTAAEYNKTIEDLG
ncbi:MAG: hypothetical protein ACRC8T_07955, partial [Acidaminococcaceae bacterium]